MTDTSKLVAEANAISNSSPVIKKFAQDAAANLVAHDGRIGLLDAQVAALGAQVANLAAPTPASPPVTSTPSGTVLPKQGLNPGSIILTAPNQDAILDAAADLANGKPTWLRLDIWTDATDLSHFDMAASKAKARGLTPMALWNQDYPNRGTVDWYAQQAAVAATRANLVNTINEPEKTWPAAELAQYLVAAYAAVKKANPQALVIGPSIFKPNDDVTQIVPYVKTMLEWAKTNANSAPMWDIPDFHPYGDVAQVEPSWNIWDWMFRNGGNNLVTLLGSYGLHAPLIATEGGANTAISYNVAGVTVGGEEYQRRSIANGMDARASLGLASFGAYAIPDNASPGGYGLKKPDWTNRLAYAEFKNRAI